MTKYILLGAIVAVGIAATGTYRLGYSKGSEHMELLYKRQVADLTDQTQRSNYEADKVAYSSDMAIVNAKLTELFGVQDSALSNCAKLCANSVQPKGRRNKRPDETVDIGLLSEVRSPKVVSHYRGYFDDPITAGSMSTDTP